ncbi:MAG: cytochrome c3 family protein [Elusimicrobia bacterium]|nr:cytochrome c3 family protein [Elusimicrobiota bacterium]
MPLLTLLLLLWPLSLGISQENDTCLSCHGEPAFTAERNGKTVSLHVDGERFSASVHGGLACADCHKDLAGAEIPHPAPLAKVACGACHEDIDKKFSDSLHGKALARDDKLAPRCQNCHGSHDIIPPSNPESSVSPIKIPFVCGSCHREGAPVQTQRPIHQRHILENYSESIHGEGLLKKGLSVSANCASCHTAHSILPHTDPKSAIARGNIVTTCTRCHSLIENVHRKVIKGELWEKKPHVIPVCVACHQPHKVRKVFYDQGMADKDCLNCHGRAGHKDEKGRYLHVQVKELVSSVHAKVACSQCHAGVMPSKKRPCETVTKKVDCSVCHNTQNDDFSGSVHGKLLRLGNPNAPQCTECHGMHKILGKNDPASATYPINVPDLCSRCHREGEKATVRYKGKEHEISKNYLESIHGKGLLKSGLVVTAMCTNCHTAHRELPVGDPASSVNQNNIAATCGRCHRGVYEKYAGSIHSSAVNKTKEELPVCSTCHTAHTIRRADEDRFKLAIMARCGRCHEKIAKTYFETYHGKVSLLGYAKTAKCHDCHGAHDVYPVPDPRSRLSRKNVVATCRACHPGATKRFAGYLTHSTHHDPVKYPLIFLTFWLMTSLLIGTFTVAGLHTLLWLPRSLQLRRRRSRVPLEPGAKQFVRFTPLNRLLHGLMIVSFITLAGTGMMLKYSYAGWAAALSRILGGFESAGYLHRMAAVIMIGIFIAHLRDLVKRKRREFGSWKEMLMGPDTMLFTRKDLLEIKATFKWYLGRGPRPAYGRWTYWEKFDYFAVFWGIAIIGSTGLTLWFPELITRLLPGWIINIAAIIHSDEALLAVGFIFTVHFFNTHFRPDKFPMDTVIFTGRVPLDELKEDRPAEYEELLAQGRLDQCLAEPLAGRTLRLMRIFGFMALAIGLTLIIGIIYATLFVYK